jgi:membrane-bound ClpP family serine protease
MSYILFFILLGLLLIALEIIFIPGTTIVGFIGAASVIVGVVYTYITFGNTVGNWSLVALLLFCSVGFVVLIKSNVWSKMALNDKEQFKTNEELISKINVGDEGLALSDLKPMGKALFHASEFTVQSSIGFIEVNSKIKITHIQASKILVEKLT